jgi:hypothetical protein
MPVEYKSIVPWGRSLNEYIEMFSLSDEDLKGSILGCGDGPASFNYEMTQMGRSVISVDPIYKFDRELLKQRIDKVYDHVLEVTRMNMDNYIWKNISSVEELGKIRMDSMKKFLADYEKGKLENRYMVAELPCLQFKDDSFDLALASHLLFLYSDQLSLDFHIRSIDELCRVSKEVRIFPLLDLNSNRSPYVDEVVEYFTRKGFSACEEKVNYEFQKGGNAMLRIKKN